MISVQVIFRIFRSTAPRRPNKVCLKCPSVRLSVRPSVHKKFLWLQWTLVCR